MKLMEKIGVTPCFPPKQRWSADTILIQEILSQESVQGGGKNKNNKEKEQDQQADDSTQLPHDDLVRDVAAGVDAIGRFTDSTWWEWKRGSTLFFWRWPAGEQRTSAHDGMPIWIKSWLPKYQRSSRSPNPLVKPLIVEKLQKILDWGYVVAPVERDFFWSLMGCFSVKKDSDIRLVYIGTSCGLNNTLWAPNFWLPAPATVARSLGYAYFMVDIDLGKMFLNFPLHKVLQRYSGVNFSPYVEDLKGSWTKYLHQSWVHWTRCWMGLKPSPYMAVCFYYLAKEFGRGNQRAKGNPLWFDWVCSNLPGHWEYDPTLPRVMKWDEPINNIAGDLVAFIDDLSASG
jgi:hypothetical protein